MLLASLKSKECSPAVLGGLDIPATLLWKWSADRPALEASKREAVRRACLLRSEQTSVVAVCVCSAERKVHLPVADICSFVEACLSQSAVDASLVARG